MKLKNKSKNVLIDKFHYTNFDDNNKLSILKNIKIF